MNICFPSLSYPLNGGPTSGVGTQVRLLAHRLIAAGDDVTVIDLATDEPDSTVDGGGVQVERVKSGRLHWFISRIPLAGKALALPVREVEYSIAVWRAVLKAHRRRKIDLIEGTETGMLFLALWWKKSPVIIRLHGEQYTFHKYTPEMRLTTAVRLSRVLQRIGLRRAKLLISPSYAHAREIQNELGNRRPPIVVVPNALEIEKTNGHKLPPRSAQTVLYAGRIEPLKGIKTLLDAAARTLNVLPESRFVFAGDFQSSLSRDEFQRAVQANNLSGNVELLGPLGWQALRDLYKSSTLAVLPSHYETFGLAALEPMAFGTPVVASDSSALSEIVVAEINGKLVAPGDCEGLAKAMIEMLSRPAAREQMGKAAIEHAAHYDVGKVLPLNKRLYQWCVADSVADSENHIFFSPHLDDAVFSCGGAIHTLRSQDKDVRVITVFAGADDGPHSAFARHLQTKWRTGSDTGNARRAEDAEALRGLDVRNFEQWDYPEAPFRHDRDGSCLYSTYEELRSGVAHAERELVDNLTARIRDFQFSSGEPVLYFPLALGQHIDHQILFEVGRNLSAAGKQVRFYEDFPYAEDYDHRRQELNWLPRTVSISLAPKVAAAKVYKSQLRGLGGAVRLQQRMRRFASRLGTGAMMERYWEMAPAAMAPRDQQSRTALEQSHDRPAGLRDFKRFIETFRWHDLNEALPAGTGSCINLGCGNGRHKSTVESKGYQWFGFDRFSSVAGVRCDAAELPVVSQSQAAVLAWQVLEYVERPEQVIAEAARVLETGGVFCGTVSFLEPVHGRTYFNLSPLILRKLLNDSGFADIQITPGLNGFALMMWTWLRRSGIPAAERAAIPGAFLMLVPFAALLYVASWLSRLMGFGSGHFMQWVTRSAPLEFAGHVMFTARKRAV